MKTKLLVLLLLSTVLNGQSIINTSAISHDLDSSLSLVLDAGADFSRGNSSVNNISSSFGLGKSLTEDASIWILGGYNQLAINGETQQQASYGHLRVNYEIIEGITLNAYGQFQSNSVLAMDSRFLSGANVDFDFGKDKDLMIAVGAFREFEDYKGGLTSNLVRGNAVVVAEHKTAHVEVAGFAYFQPSLSDLSDYRCIGELSLRFPITNDLQLSMNAAARFDSSPHSGLNSTDVGLTTTIRYELHSN
mgnify:CR=1 FL=1